MMRPEINPLTKFITRFPLEIAGATLAGSFYQRKSDGGDVEYYRQLAEFSIASLVREYLSKCQFSLLDNQLLVTCPNREIQEQLIANLDYLSGLHKLLKLLDWAGLEEIETISIMYVVGKDEKGRQIIINLER